MNKSLDINNILLNSYIKLGLNENELVCLMHLFTLYEKGKTALSNTIIRGRMSLNQKEIANILDSLVSKGFMDINTEFSKNGKEQECFELLPTFQKIESMLYTSLEEEKKANRLKQISQYVDLFEHELARSLSPVELDIINSIANKYSLKETRDALIEAAKKGKTNVKQVETILSTNEIVQEEVDEKHANAIKEFYKRVSK